MLTKHQLEIRRGGVTASEIGAVIGINPWKGAGQVWLDKVKPGKVVVKDNPEMERGRILEGPILRWMSRKEGIFIKKIGRSQETIICKKRPLIIATPDAIVYKEKSSHRPIAVAEVKSPGENVYDHWYEDSLCRPPLYVVTQAMWQMAALNLRKAYIGALVRSHFYSWIQEWDQTMFDHMYQCAKEFWSFVKRRVPPPLNFNEPELTKRFLAQFHDKNRSERIRFVSDPAVNEAARRLIELKGQIATLDRDQTNLENALKSEIGQESGIKGEIGGKSWLVTWKNTEPVERVDIQKVKKSRSYKKYVSVFPGARKFLIRNT